MSRHAIPARSARVAVLLTLAAVLTVLVGCGVSNPHAMGTYDRAFVFREAGKHREAVDAYGLFLRRSPTDSLAVQGQYEKALSYMELKEYPMAVVELQILRQEYPTSALVEEAMYMEGVGLLKQVGRVERDMTPGFEAREHFLDFLTAYPTTPRRADVDSLLTEISDMAVRKQLSAVDLYRRLKRHESASITLDRLLATERKTTLRDKLLWERARTARKLGADDELEFLDQLIEEHPETRYLKQAVARRNELAPPGGS